MNIPSWIQNYSRAWNVSYSSASVVTLWTPTNQVVWNAWNRVIFTQANPVQRRSRIEQVSSLADKRAEKLLEEQLSAAQREELAAQGFFTLRTIAPTGEGRIYRIRRGRSRNVEQVDGTGRVIKTLCAHPQAMVPDADTMLAQKLMLEFGEEEFLLIANHS
jgi:hypothetical protein